MRSQDFHILIWRTFEYVTLYGKRDTIGVFEFRNHEMERLSWIIQVDPM